VLDVRGVRKRYGQVTALDGVDLSIDPGQILALLGPNGAGKTTLVSIVAGLLCADAGEVTVCGIDVGDDPVAARRCLGLAPQELGVYPLLTTRENLVFFGEVAGLRSRALRQRIDEVAEDLELGDFLDRKAQFLSGGEKRRLHTAMAMIHRPALLLLDEPTTGVDVTTRAHLIEVVRRLAGAGTAICYSTHYLPEVEVLGASVAIIDRGRVIAAGDAAELVRRHSRPALELIFDGAPPAGLERQGRQVDLAGNRAVIHCPDPPVEAGRVLAALGEDASRVRSVQFLTASLEAVFLGLTGRRYESEEREDSDDRSVLGVA
jgi:ABC-2 type transport system ATP-binding protein